MGRPKNTPDSYAPLLVEVDFLTEPVTSLGSMDYLQSISLEVSSEGSWSAHVVLFDSQGDTLEGLAFSNNKHKEIQFRFGWDNPAAPQIPWWRGAILRYTPTFTSEGTQLALEIVPTTMLDSALRRQSRSFPAGMTATEIFVAIAQDPVNNWLLHDERGKSTVEASAGALEEYPFRGESDVEFITDRLLKQAVNTKNDHFLFRLVGRTAYFHSVTYTPDGSNYPLAADYVFYADNAGEVIEFTPTDNVVEASLMGGGNASFTGASSQGGTALEIVAKAMSGIQAQSGVTASALTIIADASTKRQVAADFVHSKIYKNARSIEELQRLAAHHWSELSQFTYRATLVVRGTHAVMAYDRIQVRRIMKNGKVHYMSGVFLVDKVSHDVGSSGWTTTMQLCRMGVPRDSSEATSNAKLDASTRAAAVPDASTQTSIPTTSPNQPTGVTHVNVPIRKAQ